MKQARLRKRVRPRNLLAINPLLKKSGAHQRTDKHASRARRKAQQRRNGNAA